MTEYSEHRTHPKNSQTQIHTRTHTEKSQKLSSDTKSQRERKKSEKKENIQTNKVRQHAWHTHIIFSTTGLRTATLSADDDNVFMCYSFSLSPSLAGFLVVCMCFELIFQTLKTFSCPPLFSIFLLYRTWINEWIMTPTIQYTTNMLDSRRRYTPETLFTFPYAWERLRNSLQCTDCNFMFSKNANELMNESIKIHQKDILHFVFISLFSWIGVNISDFIRFCFYIVSYLIKRYFKFYGCLSFD